MKNLLSVLLLCFAGSLFGQAWLPDDNYYGRGFQALSAKRTIQFPTGNGTPATPSSADMLRKRAQLYYDSTGSKLWVYNPRTELWDTLGGASGGGIQDLQSVLGFGNIATISAYIPNLYLYDSSALKYGKLQIADGQFRLYPDSAGAAWAFDNINNGFRFRGDVLTAPRVRTMANADGNEVLSVNGQTANTVGEISLSAGSVITFPNTAGKYYNGYGDFPSLRADSVSLSNASFKVLTGTNLQLALDQTDAALLKQRGVGVSTQGTYVTVTTGGTTFNLAAGNGEITIRDGINPPRYFPISWPAASSVPLASVALGNTWIYIDTLGVISQQTTFPTDQDENSKIFLARIPTNGTGVSAVVPWQTVLANPAVQIKQFTEFFPYRKQGLGITPNADLTFATAAGSILVGGGGSLYKPNAKDLAATNPTTFSTYIRTGTAVASGQTNVPVTQYDNAGTLTAMTNNRFVIHKFWKYTSGNVVMQYGQTEYTSLTAAQDALLNGNTGFIDNPILLNGARIAYIIVKKNATDLTNVADAFYKNTNADGEINGGASSGSAGTVTNVATGFGLLGGPITTTGTLNADSSLLATRARLTNSLDSLVLTISNNYQSKLNGTGYVKMSGTTASYQSNAQLTTDINNFTTTLKGAVPPPTAINGFFLRDDGTWAAAAGGGGFTNPMTTRGDIITGATGGTPQRLGLGSAGTVLTSDGTDAVWTTFVPYIRYIAASKSAVAADGGFGGTGSNGGTNANAYNYFWGQNSGYKITTGINNLGIGLNTLDSIVDADGNIAIGGLALSKMTGPTPAQSTVNYGTLAIGYEALANYTMISVASEASNMAIGRRSLYTLTTGYGNTGIGLRTLELNSIGIHNTALGVNAGSLVIGNYGTYLGSGSGISQTSGNYSTYTGYRSGQSWVSGNGNTLTGALSGSGVSPSGSDNSGVGYTTFANNTSGSRNIELKSGNANSFNTSGSNNVSLNSGFALNGGNGGSNGSYPTTANNCITIGDRAGLANATTNNQVNFGNHFVGNGAGSYVWNGTNTGGGTTFLPTFKTSAMMEFFSTTKGSIPNPIQTDVQFAAISSKTAGLHAYSTDKKLDVFYDGTVTSYYSKISTGTAAPATTPTAVGEMFVDTSNKKAYIATGTSSSADWTILN